MSIEGRKDNRSFNLPEKYMYSGAVKGNGIALGLERTSGSTVRFGLVNNAFGDMGGLAVKYGVALATDSQTSISQYSTQFFVACGITSESDKSGIICEKDTQISMIIKY